MFKLTIKTPDQCHWCHWYRSGVFIFKFEHFTPCFSVIYFEQVNGSWVISTEMFTGYHISFPNRGNNVQNQDTIMQKTYSQSNININEFAIVTKLQ